MKKHLACLPVMVLFSLLSFACDSNAHIDYCYSEFANSCPSKETQASKWVGKQQREEWGKTLSVDDGPTMTGPPGNLRCCYMITTEKEGG